MFPSILTLGQVQTLIIFASIAFALVMLSMCMSAARLHGVIDANRGLYNIPKYWPSSRATNQFWICLVVWTIAVLGTSIGVFVTYTTILNPIMSKTWTPVSNCSVIGVTRYNDVRMAQVFAPYNVSIPGFDPSLYQFTMWATPYAYLNWNGQMPCIVEDKDGMNANTPPYESYTSCDGTTEFPSAWNSMLSTNHTPTGYDAPYLAYSVGQVFDSCVYHCPSDTSVPGWSVQCQVLVEDREGPYADTRSFQRLSFFTLSLALSILAFLVVPKLSFTIRTQQIAFNCVHQLTSLLVCFTFGPLAPYMIAVVVIALLVSDILARLDECWTIVWGCLNVIGSVTCLFTGIFVSDFEVPIIGFGYCLFMSFYCFFLVTFREDWTAHQMKYTICGMIVMCCFGCCLEHCYTRPPPSEERLRQQAQLLGYRLEREADLEGMEGIEGLSYQKPAV